MIIRISTVWWCCLGVFLANLITLFFGFGTSEKVMKETLDIVAFCFSLTMFAFILRWLSPSKRPEDRDLVGR